ncbi:MAG: hypothetical protein WAW86_00125 [Gammaproteobacteria bacterium]
MKYLLACLTLFATLTLTSCLTPYGPYDTILGGYTDRLINQNTAIVNISTTRISGKNMAQSYALYRAAEVTIDNGYDYFIIVSTTHSNRNVRVTERENYHGYNTQPPRLYNAFPRSLSYSGYRIEGSRSPQECSNSSGCMVYGPTIVIKMYNGIVPHAPGAFDATDIMAHLGPYTYNQHY